MVCTKCGAELKDTDLFCLNCGAEVQIVPDYNPVEEIVIKNLAEAQQSEIKLENANESQNKNISGKTQKIDNKKVNTKTKDNDINYDIYKGKKIHKKEYVLITIVVLAVILIIVAATFWNIHKNSYEYQYNQAIKCMDNENYEDAFIHLENALKINSSDINARLLMAAVYIELENIYKAIKILKETLDMEPNNAEASRQLLELYSEYNYTDELNEYIAQIDGSGLSDALGEFYYNRPSFSIEGGTYDKYISVEITSKENSEIYYTVDGTKPTTSAIKYSGQIRLRGGTTQIRAVAINKSGDLSLETIKEYTVNSTVPDNPVINPASGLYSSPIPINITVPANCKVYYTLDGTAPTEQSILYTKPLDMPLGKHVLSVVAIDENGIISNTIQSNYDLEFESNFTIDEAYNILVQKLGNELVDEKGTFQLECSTAIEIGGYNLYAFEKVYGTDAYGNKIYGSDKYTFDVLTGETFYTVRNAAGGYDLTPF